MKNYVHRVEEVKEDNNKHDGVRQVELKFNSKNFKFDI